MKKNLLLSISLLFLFSACDSNTNKEQTSQKLPSTVIEKESLAQSQSEDGNLTQDIIRGKDLSSKCVACHGSNFEKSALSKSSILKGKTASEIETSLQAYKAGTLNKSGMGALMRGQVGHMADDEIKAISLYISTIK